MKNVILKRAVGFIVLWFLVWSLAYLLTACGETETKIPPIPQFTLQYQASEGGEIQGERSQIVQEGEDGLVVIAIPNEGYDFEKWSDGMMTAERQDIDVCNDITVTAIFIKKSHSVKYETDGNGSVQGKSNQTVLYGENAETVMAIPNEGYEFDKWSDGVTTATRSDTDIRNEFTVTATFKKKTYTVKYKTDGNGTIQGKSGQTVSYGENAESVTAIPNEGYEFDKWSDGVTTATRSDTDIRNELTVTAIFKKKAYTVKYSTDGNGSIQGEANQEVIYGENALAVTAIPNEGYEFEKWSDGVTTATRSDTNIHSNLTVTAAFIKKTYTVKYETNGHGIIQGQKTQTVTHGENSESVTAVAYAGYEFSGWSDGNQEETRYEENVTTDISVTAEFRCLFAGGSGIAEDPFTIETYEQLCNMRFYPQANYLLTKDLDLSNIVHEPIFNDENAFFGTFDGGGKKIENLFIECDSAYPSLFGIIDWVSAVKNLNLLNARLNTINFDTTTDKYYVGILAGISAGHLENVYLEGTITANGIHSQGVAIGGLAGMGYGLIENCSTNINLNLRDVQDTYTMYIINPYNFGGLLGVGHNVTLKNCLVNGSLALFDSNSEEVLVGGMCGYYFTESSNNAEIISCSVNAEIFGEDARFNAGGFIGDLSVALGSVMQITDCHVFGELHGSCVFGAGFIYQSSSKGELTIDSCHTENNVKARSKSSGFIDYFSGGTIINSFSSGEVATTVIIADGGLGGYAYGFCYTVTHSRIYQCYALGNVTGACAYGFIYQLSSSVVEQSFSSGEVHCRRGGAAAGFIYGVLNSSLITDCYSDKDVYCDIETDKNLSRLTISGFIVHLLSDSKLKNCYYAGKVDGGDFVSAYPNLSSIIVTAFLGNASYTAQISNCHVFLHKENVVLATIDNNAIPEITDSVSAYENPEEMHYLADILNTEESEVWVNRENEFPKLKFY